MDLYEQKYNDALERAETLIEKLESAHIKGFIYYIFPELKEDEDERIRKAIHIYLDWLDGRKDYAPKGIYSIKDMIAWLEKQKSNTRKREIDDAYLQGRCDAKHEIEKQGEQPTDKVEPYFKVGYWVILNGVVAKILDKQKYGFVGLDIDGKDFFCNYGHTDSMRLWTINDAKDGDVLVTEDYIFIFKYILHGGVHLYCHYNFDDEEFDSDIPDAVIGNIHDKGIHFRPATKEQRDFLFWKIHNAGYSWDSENKELKKIEQKPADKVESKFHEGDWIISNNKKSIYQVIEVKRGIYVIRDNVDNHEYHIGIEECEKSGRLWSINDAKDGDVLMTTKTINCPFIYRKTDYNNNLAYYYAGVSANGDFWVGCLKKTMYHFGSVADITPATKQQRNLLFQKMKNAGYAWNEEKKELRKIKPHYDISNFQNFDKVLVRQNDSSTWGVSFFGCCSGGMFMCCNNVWYEQCIPFNEKTKYLLGTTDMCPEEYINW